MRHLPVFVALAACGGLGGSKQSEACARWIECVGATTPAAVGEAVESYGENGTCWSRNGDAQACTAACKAALDEAHQLAPDEPACDSDEVPTADEGLMDGQAWTFSSEPGTKCHDLGAVYLERADGKLFVGKGARFRFVFDEMHFDSDSIFGTFSQHEDVTMKCELAHPNFECHGESEPSYADTDVGGYGNWVLKFVGTFTNGSTTAEGTLSGTVDDCEFEGDLTGQVSGT